MRVPSGLQRGASSVVSAVVSRRTWPVATSTVQRLLVLLFLSIDHSCTGNTAWRPSGDKAGVPTRLIAHKSWGVSNRGSAAKAATEKVRVMRTAKKKRENMQPAIPAARAESKRGSRPAEREPRRKPEGQLLGAFACGDAKHSGQLCPIRQPRLYMLTASACQRRYYR